MSEWIGVKDRIPDLYDEVLVYDGEFIEVDHRINSDDLDWSRSYTVTHWMPLPEPPVE